MPCSCKVSVRPSSSSTKPESGDPQQPKEWEATDRSRRRPLIARMNEEQRLQWSKRGRRV